MNNFGKVKLSLVIVLILLSLTLCACGNDDPAPGVTTEVTSGEVVDEGRLIIANNDKSNFKIVLSYRASNTETRIANNIADKLSADHGVSIELTNDFNPDDPWNKEKIQNDDHEILIGRTNRVESDEAAASISFESDWTVCVVGKKIIILADTTAGYERAYNCFFDLMKKSENGSLSISENANKTVTLKNNAFLETLLKDYSAVCQSTSTRALQAFDKFVKKVNALTEGDLKVSDKVGDESAKELIIRDTLAKNNYKLSYYDYVIIENDNKIEVVAQSPLALVSALDKLYQLIIWQDFEDQYVFRFSTDDYNPIVSDQSIFISKWSETITVPSWMNDFNEKIYAITDPQGRQMSVAHRGDVINYPEDSLEGILSAALLGADVIELDIQLTKDNIIIICHDGTLTNTTNVAELKGKNGLPNSVYISDWTYKQLMQLSLLDRAGNLTSYKIPTLYEIMSVAKDKCFLMLDDKNTEFTRDDILPMELELDACEVSFYSMFVSGSSGTAANNSFSVIKKFSAEHPELTKLASNVAKMDKYLKISGHSIRSRNWIDGATTDPYVENEQRYLEAYNAGKDLLYTNDIPRFAQYIAKTYTASNIPS